MKPIALFVFCLLLVSCNDDMVEGGEQTLSNYVLGKTIEEGAVIACAASDSKTNEILAFYYPGAGAENIKIYQSSEINIDENDYSNYIEVLAESEPFFNGHLGKYELGGENEKWIIITFELDGEIKISNPIRSKQLTKPTLWNDAVAISESQRGMPEFVWEDNPVGDNGIYFQVISDADNNLLSGTYTYNNQFQYYKLDNVVLNVTVQAPPALISKAQYNFTLMDVSVDNWVNWVVQKPFEVE